MYPHACRKHAAARGQLHGRRSQGSFQLEEGRYRWQCSAVQRAPLRPPSVNGHAPGHSAGPGAAGAAQPPPASSAPNGGPQSEAQVSAPMDLGSGFSANPGPYSKPAGPTAPTSAPAPGRASPNGSLPAAAGAQGGGPPPANGTAASAAPPGLPGLRGVQLTPAMMQAAAAAVVAGDAAAGADPLAQMRGAGVLAPPLGAQARKRPSPCQQLAGQSGPV